MLPSVRTGDICRAIKTEKVAIRNLIYRMRQSDPRADGLRMAGSIQPNGLPDVGEWQLRFRLMVDLAGLPEWVFMDRLNRRWRGVGRITLGYLGPGDDLDVLIAETGARSEECLSDFHIAAHHGGGFPLVRFHLKPQRELDMCKIGVKCRFEPMPVAFG
jgi:hypothetical protein